MKISLMIAISVLLMASCKKLSKEEQQAIARELKEREIKQIQESEIYDGAMTLGSEIATQSQKTLGAHLMKTLKEGGVEEALKYCNINAYNLVDSLSDRYSAEIKRVSHKLRNPKDAPDSLENQILDAYLYNVEEGLELSSNVQRIDDTTYLYTKPIIAANPMCLNCHGKVGDELSQENYDLIKKLYPQDNATGHKLNDLRGMWSIRLSKKEIIKNL